MFVRNAAALVLTVGLLSKDALAELITITQYASTCSAIYTSGTRSTTIVQSATTTRSVTVVQSTTTVVPVPYDDAAWNGGTPFVLEIQPDAGTDPLARRADLIERSWVSLDGSTSTNPSEAGQYYIRGGQLLSVNGSYVSTNLNVESQPFSVKDSPGSISTTFTFRDGVLNWTSPRFTGGRARFCKSPVSLVDNAQVLCQFLGSPQQPQTCTPIRLVAKPCEEVHPLSSSSVAPTGTISLSSSMGMQSMSSGGPPDQYTPPPYTTPGSRSSVVPSASTPPAPYISSSSSRSLPPLSTPAGYTSAQSSSVPSFGSPSATNVRTSSSSQGVSSSSAGPPVYGSQTPSPAPTSSSISSSSVISFASSGSPIGPINPPVYGSTSSDSSSFSSSVSISSGGVRSSATSTSSSGQPPVYPSQTPSSSVSASAVRSSSVLLSSSSSASLSSSISFVSSENRPPVYTPPALTPSSTASSTASSSLSISIPGYSSQSSPVVSPVGSSTSSSLSSPLSSSAAASSSTLQAPSSSPFQSPPIYTGAPPQPCPQGNNSAYVNAAGNVYTIYCNTDSLPASYNEPLTLDLTACIQRCNFDPQCGAVSHTGLAGGNRCYLKPTPQTYLPGTTTLAVRLAGNPAYPGVSSSSSAVSSSSQLPPVYGSTSSSSVVQSPASSSVSSSASSSAASSSLSSSTSSSMVSSSIMSSSSSSEVPSQYQGPTTTTTTTTTSSSSSSEVPEPYESTASSSISSSSSSSVEIPDEYEQTTTTTTSSSSSSEVPDQYEQTITTTSSSPTPTTTTTTTSTSSSRSSSSSAASSTIPYSSYLVLPSPTPCDFGDPPDYDEDDSYCELDLPFSIQLYGNSFTRTFASSNGYIGLNRGSSQFQVNPFPYSGIPENTIAPFFDDLFLYGRKQPRQGIYYQIEGGKVTFEWYVGRSAQPPPDKDRLSQSIYHFTMAYDSAVPNTFVYTYYAVGKTSQDNSGVNGAYAAVGFQGLDGSGASRGTTYSIRNAQITPGTQVSCSGTTNECTKVTNPIISINIPLAGSS